MAEIVQINISDGGVPKLPVPEVMVETAGLVGDRQKNLKYHGGLDRAVCLWSMELIDQLQMEGHPIAPGSTGENITIFGLDWRQLEPGIRLQLGDQVKLELTDYVQPCRTIQKSFKLRRYSRISQKRNPGMSRLYAKVLAKGHINVGDNVALI